MVGGAAVVGVAVVGGTAVVVVAEIVVGVAGSDGASLVVVVALFFADVVVGEPASVVPLVPHAATPNAQQTSATPMVRLMVPPRCPVLDNAGPYLSSTLAAAWDSGLMDAPHDRDEDRPDLKDTGLADPAWEARDAALWDELDDSEPEVFLATMAELTAELAAGSPVALFEQGAAFDSTGHSDLAVPLYREALAAGLGGIRRRRAVIQLASSLRNLGQADESLSLLVAERERGSDELDDAVVAVLALVLVDLGREREAAALAIGALAPHLPRYQRSMANYARLLVESEDPAPS